MKEVLLTIVAYLFIYAGASINSKVKSFTKDWLLQVILITIGGIILRSI